MPDVPDGYVLTADSSVDSGQVWAPGGSGTPPDAADVPFTPAGTISATNVQDAIEEVAAEAGGGGGGAEIDYVERTTDLSITATTEASPDTVVTGSAVAYDGSTIVVIEFYAAAVVTAVTSAANLIFNLWDGSTDLGRIAQVQNNSTANGTIVPVYGRRRLTPSNATHTYKIMAWRTVGNGSLEAAAPHLPAFIRITEA